MYHTVQCSAVECSRLRTEKETRLVDPSIRRNLRTLAIFRPGEVRAFPTFPADGEQDS
jgi:hypothetical protein